jgi:uncharacterized protein YigE (DUF2233 family)
MPSEPSLQRSSKTDLRAGLRISQSCSRGDILEAACERALKTHCPKTSALRKTIAMPATSNPSVTWNSLAVFLLILPLLLAAHGVETRNETFEGKKIAVTEVDLTKDRLQLFLNDDRGQPFKRLARLNAWLGEKRLGLRWATNAGMYHRDYSAVGLFVSEGKMLFPLNLAAGEGNFFLKPNAVFFVTAQGAGIVSSEVYAAQKPAAILATQSGPALVLNGRLHPAFRAGSANRLHRNGVGVASPKKVFFAITDDPINFDEFARYFRDKLGCANALFFDGTVSSLHDSVLKRSDEKIDLGPIIGITEPLQP